MRTRERGWRPQAQFFGFATACTMCLAAITSCTSDPAKVSAPKGSVTDTAVVLRGVRGAYASCTRVVLDPSGTYRIRTRDVAVTAAIAASTMPIATYVYYSSELAEKGPRQMASCDLPAAKASVEWFSSVAAHGNRVRAINRRGSVALRDGPVRAADCDAQHPDECQFFEEDCPVVQEQCDGWLAGDEWVGPEPDPIDGTDSSDFSFTADSLSSGPSDRFGGSATVPYVNCRGKTD